MAGLATLLVGQSVDQEGSDFGLGSGGLEHQFENCPRRGIQDVNIPRDRLEDDAVVVEVADAKSFSSRVADWRKLGTDGKKPAVLRSPARGGMDGRVTAP
jgi:hypothetical protein